MSDGNGAMTQDEFFGRVCEGMGWDPSAWRLAVFAEWAKCEGMPLAQTWNPLATTRVSAAAARNTGFDIGFGPGNWNSVQVGVYRDAAAGIAASVETLSLDYYPTIRRCFADETGYDGAVAEFATYVGSEAYGGQLVAFMKAQPHALPAETPFEERLLLRLFSGDEERELTHEQRLANARYRFAQDGPSLFEMAASALVLARRSAE
jgi:hypothetical protein